MARQYASVRRDFERLESIKECDDWAWAEESFETLLKNPTKATAAEIYESLIYQWLQENEPNDENRWAYRKYS